MRSHHRTPTSPASHTLLALVLLVALWSPPALPCGNVNCGPILDLSDLSGAVSYLSGGGFVICDYGLADMDNHYLYTMADATLLSDVLSMRPNVGVCPPALPPIDQTPLLSDYVYFDQQIFPANTTKLAVHLGIFVSDTVAVWQLPIQFLVNGAVPTFDSVKGVGPFKMSVRDVSQGVALITGSSSGWDTKVPSPIYPSYDNSTGTVFLSMPPSPTDRSLTIAYKAVGPVQDTTHVTTPMMISPWPTRIVKVPSIRYSCCFGTRGNVNTIGSVDLADLSLLVSFLTGGISSLPCPEEANVNGLGAVDLGDLSLLVAVLTGGSGSFASCR
jgi:hypothetical protein